MQHNTDKQTATVRQKAPTQPHIASINGQLLEEIKHYKAHADKLAEACKQALGLYSALLLSEPVKATVDGQQYVLNQMREALAAYEEAKQ